ncbi:hypothetical protein GCM10009792_12030 [Microcella alkalica]
MYVQGMAPLSRIHATATEVSRPPENAMPTRSPTGRDVKTLDTIPESIGGRARPGDAGRRDEAADGAGPPESRRWTPLAARRTCGLGSVE